jgi:hypothetical protein
MQTFGNQFNTLGPHQDPPQYVPRFVRSESAVDSAIISILDPRIRRAVRDMPLPHGYQRLVYGPGSFAHQIGRFFLDRAAVQNAAQHSDTAPINRCPGDVKCSWKWHPSWQYLEYVNHRRYMGPFGELELAAPVQWGAHHSPDQEQLGLTVVLALAELHSPPQILRTVACNYLKNQSLNSIATYSTGALHCFMSRQQMQFYQRQYHR